MEWCCVPQLFRIRFFQAEGGLQVREKIAASSSSSATGDKPVDLLSDEGAGVQDDLWRLTVQQKLRSARLIDGNLVAQLSTHTTFDSALESLTRSYNENGFAKRMPLVQSLLNLIRPFTIVISTMVQADPTISTLVWGSVQLVLQCAMRFASLFEDIDRMLQEISRVLPRFQAYIEIFHTPRLHQALREVYEVYIDFNFTVIRFFRRNKCYAMAKAQWSTLGVQFEETRRLLALSLTNFEAELRLADVQTQAKRHQRLLGHFNSFLKPASGNIITNAIPARNVMFTGRNEVLAQIHAILEQSFNPDAEARVQRSCILRGIGGMGKTQTALEYTYRYRGYYSYIFWLHAEFNATLLESFLMVTAKLPLELDGLDNNQRIIRGLEWFESAPESWLLVFDNVDEVSAVKRFWPGGVRGAIIVTSQNPDLANLVQEDIHIQPMGEEEGSALIQRYLRRGGSEQSAAEKLSRDLGGLPLAITHFAGYVANSQCTIDQISQSLNQRLKSSQIWIAEAVASNTAYNLTLATVWDLAWLRLPEDPRKVLELISFLNPDAIPEDLFLGGADQIFSSNWQYWDPHRFNEAIRILRKRHLVERNVTATGIILSTHRALQRTILHSLDNEPDNRQLVFEEVSSMVRKAFPVSDLARRGDLKHSSIYEKYLPQIISMNNAFVQSEPKIDSTLDFVGILHDAAYFLQNKGMEIDAVHLLETVIQVFQELLPSERTKYRSLLISSLSILQMYSQFFGICGRYKARELAADELRQLEERLAAIPKDEWTDLDKIAVVRALVDVATTHNQLNDVDKAYDCLSRALECYYTLSDQIVVATRLAQIISGQVWFLAAKQKISEAQKLANEACAIIEEALGKETPLTLQIRYCAAFTDFTIGDIDRALLRHKEVFELRQRDRGKNAQDTLASQYNLAVCYQNTGQLEMAEHHLRENLKNSYITIQWRNEDVARTRFRLSLVLQAMSRPSEAEVMKEEAMKMREEWQDALRDLRSKEQTSDKDQMELFDFGVTLWHGRTTGIWSDGLHW